MVKCVDCLISVSVPTRMAIYNFLNHGETTVSEIVNYIKLTQPTVSYHLKEMKDSGLLKSRREGKEVFYSVSETCPHYDEECVLHGLQFPEAKSA